MFTFGLTSTGGGTIIVGGTLSASVTCALQADINNLLSADSDNQAAMVDVVNTSTAEVSDQPLTAEL